MPLPPSKRVPAALTIAGSDSGGGAGIQADLKTFSALGVYGASAITAITAQNTRGVEAVQAVAPAMVQAQISAVLDDIAIDAIKIGMLGEKELIEAVFATLTPKNTPLIVLDPVMISKSGARLLPSDAIDSLRQHLAAADLITPNLREAEALLNCDQISDSHGMLTAAARLRDLGAPAVLLKGGHLKGSYSSSDLLLDDVGKHWFEAVRIETPNTHGTGCTLSAAIAALSARGQNLVDAVAGAKQYLSAALAQADRLGVGGGWGPVHHFYRQWD